MLEELTADAAKSSVNALFTNVELRRTVGDWVGDTVIGAGHKQAIVILVERKCE